MLYLFLFYTMKFMAYNFRYQRVMGTRHAFYFKLPLKLKKKKELYSLYFPNYSFNHRLQYFFN